MSTSSFGNEHQRCTDDGNPVDTHHRSLLHEIAAQVLVVMVAGLILAVGAGIKGAAMAIPTAAMVVPTAALAAAMAVVSHVPSVRRSTAPFRGLPLPSERYLAVACYILICSPELDTNTMVSRVCASLVGEVVGSLSRSVIWGQEQASIPAAENEPAQQEASQVPAAQRLWALSDLLSNPAERPYVDELAAKRFHASFRPVLACMSSAILISISLAAGGPAIRPRLSVFVPLFVAFIVLRRWLHTMQDQQRARLLCGHAVVALNVACALGLIIVTNSTNTITTTATFLFTRAAVVGFLLPCLAYCAVPMGHCLAVAFTHAVGSTLLPQISEHGRPLEPIITCAAVLMNSAICFAVKEASWHMFKEAEALKRERSEAQARADAAVEKHQALEADSIARKLANAEANRVADSQLNHMIKGLCGAAKTYNHCIEAGVFDPQCTSWARYSILALNSAIQWAQSRQVLISLADGTFQSTRTDCQMDSVLREMLSDEDVVQVHISG